MLKFLLVLRQENGYDYTIGCGTVAIEFDASDIEEANKKTLEIAEFYGTDRISETKLYQVYT